MIKKNEVDELQRGKLICSWNLEKNNKIAQGIYQKVVATTVAGRQGYPIHKDISSK